MRRSIAVLGVAAATALFVLTAGVVSAGGKPKPPPASNPVIVFTQSDNVYVMDEDGSNVRLVAAEPKGSSCGAIDWSPNGDWIVWSLFRGPEIEKARPDGTGRTVLLQNGGYEYGFARWSPGPVVLNVADQMGAPVADDMGEPIQVDLGEKIAFGMHGEFDGTRTTHLFLMDTNGENVVDLTEVSPFAPGLTGLGWIAWSPEADRIVAVSDAGHIVVFELVADVYRKIRIAEWRDITGEAWDAGRLDYLCGTTNTGPMDWANTPGSNRIVVRYFSGDPYHPGHDIYVLEWPALGPSPDPGDYGMTTLTTAAGDGWHEVGAVAWSPDDTKVIATFPKGYPKWKNLEGIWKIDATDGANRVQVSSGYGAACIEWWAGATK